MYTKKENDFTQRIFIRPSEIQRIYGISRSTVYRLMKRGEFPEQVSLSPRCVGWPKNILDEHFGYMALSINE